VRHFFLGLVALAFVTAVASSAIAKTETVTGKVVDQGCYTKDKANNAGLDHKMPADMKDCALACAKKGLPLALVTSDGKVYQITGDLAANQNAKLIPHVSHTIEVTGETGGTAEKMTISASDLKMISK
jgi:hypothetical protein